MRTIALASLLAASAMAINAQSLPAGGPPGELSLHERWDLYLHGTYMNPLVPLRNGATAGLAQWMDSPSEWGQGAEGYGRRLGHRLARFTIKSSYEAAAAAMLGHDVRYFPSRSAGIPARAAHALVSGFVTYDHGGNRVPRLATIASSFAVEYTAMQWTPQRYRTHSRVLRNVAIGFGAGWAVDLVREFSPELRRLFHR